MTSTYSSNLKIELMATGDQSGTWGDTTNTNLGTLLEQAIAGYTTQSLTAVANPFALTIPNGVSGTGRYYVIEFTGTVASGQVVTVPAVQKPYIFYNNGSTNSVTVKVSGQTGVTIAVGKKAIVYTNGTDVIEVANAPVTEAGTQTLTNKTLTSPTINTGTISGGTINNTAIGGTTPLTGAFTTVSSTGDYTMSGTGQMKLATGTTAQRSGTPTSGMIRFNSDSTSFEGYNGSAWGNIGGGAAGGGSDAIFWNNGQTVNTSYSIPATTNAGTFGPVTIGASATVTIPSSSTWTVV